MHSDRDLRPSVCPGYGWRFEAKSQAGAAGRAALQGEQEGPSFPFGSPKALQMERPVPGTLFLTEVVN